MTQWILYDDPASEALRPFTWLRPASALLLGAQTNLERWRHLSGETSVTVACRDLLAPLEAGRKGLSSAMEETDAAQGSASNGAMWVSDLLMGDPLTRTALASLAEDEVAQSSGELVGFRPGPRIGAILRTHSPQGALWPALREIQGAGLAARDIPGRRLRGLGDLIDFQAQLLTNDLQHLLRESNPAFQPGDGVSYHPEDVRLGEGCRVDHGAVLDAREGPVVLSAGCEVAPHTWIKGPFFAAAGSKFLGGTIGSGSSIGPHCKVRGEVEASVFLGLSNKAHDGFVGHSYVGEWVNLGALTTTSDLKNNYSFVTLEPEGRKERTTLRKVGVFLGDHVKTRIGCLLQCGTIVGLGANLIGEPAVARKWVADFSWGSGPEAVEYEINKFLQTAEIVFGRRGVAWTPAVVEAIRAIHAATAPARRGQVASS